MRFHFGFSKRIKLSTLLKIGAVLLGALGIYFGATSMVFASETESAFSPSQVQYYSPQYADPLTASVFASGDNYWWLATINNYGGNSTNVNFIYNANNVCNTSSGTSTKVKFRYTVQYNGSSVPSNISGIYASGGGSINFSIEQASANDYWATAYIDLSRPFRLIFAQSNQTTETINLVGVSKIFVVDCAYSIQNSTEDIINNNNQNTQDIIDNQNQNAQDIIDNQNQNTQDTINSQKVCSLIDKSKGIIGGYLSPSGNVTLGSNTTTTDFIPISKNTEIVITESTTAGLVCFYYNDKTKLSCPTIANLPVGTVISVPENSAYVRFNMTISSNKPQFRLCRDGNQAIVDSNNQLNDSLTNDNVSGATSNAESLFGNADVSEPIGLTSIITAPIRLLQSLINGGSCNGFTFSINLNGTDKSVTIPSGCILWDNVPSTVVALYQTMIFGLFGYRLLVDMVHFIDSLRDPDKKNEYTLDL